MQPAVPMHHNDPSANPKKSIHFLAYFDIRCELPFYADRSSKHLFLVFFVVFLNQTLSMQDSRFKIFATYKITILDCLSTEIGLGLKKRKLF